ncbi:hypothetical protein [Roseovarius mucosus]|uniref:hypothetical protein n=1 Tax=Roseovarius mucosus TaxID=215743 RepID=UPI003BA90C5E
MPSLLLRALFTGYVSEQIVVDVAGYLREDRVRCHLSYEDVVDGAPAYHMSIKPDRPICDIVEMTLSLTPVDTLVQFSIAMRERGRTIDECTLFQGAQPGRRSGDHTNLLFAR